MTRVFIEVGEKQENVSHDGKDAAPEGRLGLGDFPRRQEWSPSPNPQLADIHPPDSKEGCGASERFVVSQEILLMFSGHSGSELTCFAGSELNRKKNIPELKLCLHDGIKPPFILNVQHNTEK